MNLQEELKIFSECCTKCGGKCCYGSSNSLIPLSEKEAEHIMEMYPHIKIYQYTSSQDSSMKGFHIPKEGCPLLGEKGCILPEKYKPLNCSCYPIVFTYKNKKLDFYFDESKLCPYIKDLEKLETWKEYTLKDILNKTQSWTDNELNFFTELSERTKKTNKKINL